MIYKIKEKIDKLNLMAEKAENKIREDIRYENQPDLDGYADSISDITYGITLLIDLVDELKDKISELS